MTGAVAAAGVGALFGVLFFDIVRFLYGIFRFIGCVEELTRQQGDGANLT